ncbi:MAG: carboxypeptidase regulatory-like domain-containing protein [Gemmatimonadetes bacterium]|nr:carboxypeptidase regulatory-like domain-containing protein [Gemmatimonadota bacterium]
MKRNSAILRLHAVTCTLLLILGLSVNPTRLAAQVSPRARTVTVTGVVRDSTTGEVLPNARVTMAGLSRAVRSNADGRFTMLGVPATTDTLLVQYIGYTTRRFVINADTIKAPLVVALAHSVVQLATTQVIGGVAPTVVSVGRDAGQLAI